MTSSNDFKARIDHIAKQNGEPSPAWMPPQEPKKRHPISISTYIGVLFSAVVAWTIFVSPHSDTFDLGAAIDNNAPDLSELQKCMKSDWVREELAERNFANPALAARLMCS